MLLGKRQPPPMKRTTSLREISVDLGETRASHQSDDHQSNQFNGEGVDQRFLSLVSPRNNNQRRRSADFLETLHFLRACGLCKRRLVPGRDIYMYRDDSAFCSLECRQQRMNQDESKCSYASPKKKAAASSSTAVSQVSVKGDTVAAVQ